MNTLVKNNLIFSSPMTLPENNVARLKALKRLVGSISNEKAKKWLADIKKSRKEWDR